jgi:hypothetical protein
MVGAFRLGLHCCDCSVRLSAPETNTNLAVMAGQEGGILHLSSIPIDETSHPIILQVVPTARRLLHDAGIL